MTHRSLALLALAPLLLADPAATARPAVPPTPAWRWDGGKVERRTGAGVMVALETPAFLYRFTGSDDAGYRLEARHVPPRSVAGTIYEPALLWTARPPASLLVDDAALLARGGALYVAYWDDISDGCTVVAYDAATGRVQWTARLLGIGPVAHSKYWNRVQLQWIGGRLVAFGSEAAGRYVEVLDPATGARLANRRLPGLPEP